MHLGHSITARSRRLLALTLSTVVGAFTPAPSHAQSDGRVSGVITDSATHAPVSDALIAIRATTRAALTDQTGRFVLNAVPRGTHYLTVQRLGYAPVERRIEVIGGVLELTLQLAPSAQEIAPMVVSATREAQRRRDASATIDVLDGAEIREARAAHPAAIVQRVPGVHVSQLSGEGHSTAIRQPITTKPLYLYLEDGVPTRSTGFFNHNALYEVNLPQAGGLEVLKGPGTALYGSDAIGGVINALTRPGPVSPTLDVATEAGSYGYRRLLATGGFTRGVGAIRADLNLTQATGFKKDAPYDRISATVRHDLSMGSAVSVRTVLTGTSVDQRDVFALNSAAFARRPELNRSPIAFRDVFAVRWSTAVDVDRGRSLLSATPYVRHNVLDLLPNWQLTYNPEVWNTKNDSYGLLLKYRRDFDRLRARVIVGADLEDSPGSVRYNGIVATKTGQDSVWTAYTVGARHYDYDVTYRQASPYLHVEVSPFARLRFDAGLRYDHSSYLYDTRLASIQTGRFRVPADTTRSFSRVSPKVGVTLDVAKGLNVYGSYRQGFRAPAQGQLFQQGSNANTTGLEPVTANSAEAGVRGTVGARVSYSLAWYDMRVKNDILSILDATGVSTSSNAGETRHRGAELALGASLPRSLRLDVAWSSSVQTYQDWLIPVQGKNVSYAGRTIEQAPHTLGNVLASWSPRVLHGGRLALEWSHTGRYYMDPENTHAYDGFDVWTVHANMMVRDGELFARVANLRNTRYAELVSYNAFNKEQYTPGNPRMIYAGVRWSWHR